MAYGKAFRKGREKGAGEGGRGTSFENMYLLKRIPHAQRAVESVERDYLWLVVVAGFITNGEYLAFDMYMRGAGWRAIIWRVAD